MGLIKIKINLENLCKCFSSSYFIQKRFVVMRYETAYGDSSLSHSAPRFVLYCGLNMKISVFTLPVMSDSVIGLEKKNLVKSGNYPNMTLTKKGILLLYLYWHDAQLSYTNCLIASSVFPVTLSFLPWLKMKIWLWESLMSLINIDDTNFSKNFI